jgi:hypothetical protein
MKVGRMETLVALYIHQTLKTKLSHTDRTDQNLADLYQDMDLLV